MDHEIGRVAGGLPNSDSFSPKDEGENLSPLRFVSFAGLHDSFTNVKVFRLNNSVGLRIVARDTNVSDSVSRCEDVQCSDVSRAVVCNNFLKSTPSTEDVLEDEVRYDFG